MKDDTFDYRAYVKETPPEPEQIHRGVAERQQRFDAAMMKFSVRIDENVLKEFRQLATEEESYDVLINRALRDWLSARNLKELVRLEIQRAIQQSLSAAQPGTESSPS